MEDLRASDAEREQTAEVLRHAAGEGRLTVDDLEHRLTVAYGASTRSELAVLTRDVVEAVPAHRVPVASAEGATSRIVSVMSGADRKGRWRLAPKVSVINVMGGSDLDLNEAEFATDVVEMRVFSFWGGADIRVPDGLNVEVSEFNLLGGNDIDIGDARPDPGGPTLRLHLISIMSGTNVKRGPKRGWLKRRRERREIHRDHRP